MCDELTEGSAGLDVSWEEVGHEPFDEDPVEVVIERFEF